MLSAKPLYPEFSEDFTNAQFLGSHHYCGESFDLYFVDGVDQEIVAAGQEFSSTGGMAMVADLCTRYKQGHPLCVGYELARQQDLF